MLKGRTGVLAEELYPSSTGVMQSFEWCVHVRANLILLKCYLEKTLHFGLNMTYLRG